MHVCHFCDTSVESDYFRHLAAGLTQNGIRVSLIELRSGKSPTWVADMPNVSYLSLEANCKLQYPGSVKRLAHYLADEVVDIVHTHLFFAGLIGVLAKRRNRKIVVALMRHHTSVVRMLGSRLHIAADKWMAEKADHVMTVSEAARDYMMNIDGITRNDIKVVYLGFDFEKISPNTDERMRVRREFGFAENEVVIGYVAHFATGKGHIQLVKAFAKIAEKIPNAKLFFVGRGMLDEVKKATAKFSSDKIVFAGWRDDVAACLNAMDFFVQPSLSEAFSQVLVEAMGVGIPVIATDVGGAAEVIDNGINGILVKPNDVDAIAAHVVELHKDDDLRRGIAAAGQKSVTERFTVERLVDRHLELYNRWMDERPNV